MKEIEIFSLHPYCHLKIKFNQFISGKQIRNAVADLYKIEARKVHPLRYGCVIEENDYINCSCRISFYLQ